MENITRELNEILNNEIYRKEFFQILSRELADKTTQPKFSGGNVPVYKAAEALGKHPDYVREGIKNGSLKIGYAAIGENGKWNFHISPKKLYEYSGYIYENALVESINEKEEKIS